MARTKASVGAKVAARKSSKARCSAPPPPIPSTSGASERGSRSYSGGNPICPRDTPNWQKPITNFFISKDCDSSDSDDMAAADNPKSRPKRNIIESDEDSTPEKPKNKELDETIDLEPLNGDNSHKIEEYYPTNVDVKNEGEPQNSVMAENSTNGDSIEENNNNNAVNKTGTKGKGVGKKSKGKENIGGSSKREREEQCVTENLSKRIKAD